MAMQPDIQYVSFYMDGSAAKKLEKQTVRRAAAPKPVHRKGKRTVVKIDPVAVLGIVVAVVMLITMFVGVAQYRSCLQQQQQMSRYIDQLQQENLQLKTAYSEGYDLENIRQIAQAIGMVPRESAEHIYVDVQVPQPEPEEPTFWEAAVTFLAGLFA